MCICMQLSAERRLLKDRDRDLPEVPSGSLGSLRCGMQSLPLRVQQLLGEHKVAMSTKLRRLYFCQTTQRWESTIQHTSGKIEVIL